MTFGPQAKQNHSKRVNKKMKQAALRMVLTDKLSSNSIFLVESADLPEIKTKQVVGILNKLPLKGRKTLFVVEKDSRNLVMSSRNITDVSTLGADSLNVLELMKAQSIVIPVASLSRIEELYAKRDRLPVKSVKTVVKKKAATKKVTIKKIAAKKAAKAKK